VWFRPLCRCAMLLKQCASPRCRNRRSSDGSMQGACSAAAIGQKSGLHGNRSTQCACSLPLILWPNFVLFTRRPRRSELAPHLRLQMCRVLHQPEITQACQLRLYSTRQRFSLGGLQTRHCVTALQQDLGSPIAAAGARSSVYSNLWKPSSLHRVSLDSAAPVATRAC
jgi:hypothetical protein